MDITKIPKFVMWGGIAIFVISVLYLGYTYIFYDVFGPQAKYISIKCQNAGDNTIFMYLTAKQDIDNITIYDDNDKKLCYIASLKKDSEDLCKITNLTSDLDVYPFKISYYIPSENRSMSIIVNCKLKKGLLEKII